MVVILTVGIGPAGAEKGAARAPVKSIQQLMDAVVDPSADALWDVAGTVVENGKTTVRQPHTDKEWAAAKALADKLISGARQLQSPHPVGSNGHWRLADAATPGIRSAAQIEVDIASDPSGFYKAASRLQRTAEEARSALDARNIPAFLDAGARIDAACEACHAAYWYPRDPPGDLPSEAVFAQTAIRP